MKNWILICAFFLMNICYAYAQNAQEAIAALTALGYTQTEASVAISKLDQSLSVEDLIKGALKNMTLRF